MADCTHKNVRCLNGHELIRKYQCADCKAVMMCSCDEEVGRKYLSHQLSEGRELETQDRVPVTAGFVPNTCETCRGLPAIPYPAAAIVGRTSNVRRYYWREIAFQSMKRFDAWSAANAAHGEYSPEAAVAHKRSEKEVVADIQRLHMVSPKYIYRSEPDAEVIKQYSVERVALKAQYTKDPSGNRAIIIGPHGPCTVEQYVAEHYKRQAYDVLPLESRPFHVLFGIFMWLVIQDYADPLIRTEGFGDRIAYENRQEGKLVWFQRPQDFGTKGYATRRADAIDEHLAADWLDEGQLSWLFDLWLEPSEKLRQYLWAHKAEDGGSARKLIDIIPPGAVVRILRYLVENYWHHYLGWPDFLIYRPGEFFFAEVKASGDQLSDEQKQWIKGNHDQLHLPFKLVKVDKAS
jgi:hypothetical protein